MPTDYWLQAETIGCRRGVGSLFDPSERSVTEAELDDKRGSGGKTSHRTWRLSHCWAPLPRSATNSSRHVSSRSSPARCPVGRAVFVERDADREARTRPTIPYRDHQKHTWVVPWEYSDRMAPSGPARRNNRTVGVRLSVGGTRVGATCQWHDEGPELRHRASSTRSNIVIRRSNGSRFDSHIPCRRRVLAAASLT